jgi:hypothetical protein
LAVIGGIPVLLWFLRTLIVADGAHGPIYFQQYGLKDYTSVDSKILGLRDLYELVYHNLYVYTRAAAETVLPDFIGPPGTIVAILVTAMIGMGFLICVRMRRTGLEYYGLAYACALLPYPAPYPRYLVPVIPLLWYYALVSLWHGLRLLPLGRRRHTGRTAGEPVVWVVVTVLIGLNLVASVDNLLLDPTEENAYRIDQEEARYVDTLPWVEEHTTADSVFMWAKSSLRYLAVHRRAAMLPTTANRQEIIETINEAQVDYVAIDAFSDSSLRYLKPVIDEHPEKFSLVYEDQTTQIYQVVR